MNRSPRKSGRWGRSPLTVYLELIAMTLAGLVILALAQRIF
jgi:hypothetical protein